MRYLCIDLGDRRTGLAVGDDQTRIASPAGVIEAGMGTPALQQALARAMQDHGPGALVVGMPLNMDGSEGPRAKATRAFAQGIASAAGLPLHFQDERLSSAQADWTMARSGLTRGGKKARRDALAAATILADFLATLPPPPQDSPPSDDPGEPRGSIGR